MRAALVAAALLAVGCSHNETPRVPGQFSRQLDAVVDRWLEDAPSWGRQVGMHTYDGRVAHYSKEAIAAHAAWLKKTRAELEAAQGLGPDEALDRDILVAKMRLELFNFDERQTWRTDPRFYEELCDVSSYVNFDYAPLAERAARLVDHEEHALVELGHVAENLAPELSRPLVETAVGIYRGYGTYLRGDVKKLIGEVKDAALQARFAKSNEALAAAADELATRLEKEWLPRASDTAHVLGPERYLRFVEAQEGMRVDLAEFSRMADQNLAENKAAYDALAATVKPTRPPVDKLFGEATRLMDASRAFVTAKRLFTIPSDDRAKVEVSPPYMRWNAAFLNMPGPFDSVHQGFYYITLPDPAWSAEKQEGYIFPYGTLLATTVHEVYPGHFLHGLWIRRAPTRVQKMGDSYSFTEGWAHYGEQVMIEEGFGADDPQNRLGQLSDALLRNCRFVVSIGLHAKNMPLAEAERRFRQDCYQDEAGSREQAVRGTFDPGYFAYTLGKLQLLALRREAKEKLGARFDLRAFHDAVLAHGAPPIALIRQRVLADLGAVAGAK